MRNRPRWNKAWPAVPGSCMTHMHVTTGYQFCPENVIACMPGGLPRLRSKACDWVGSSSNKLELRCTRLWPIRALRALCTGAAVYTAVKAYVCECACTCEAPKTGRHAW